MVFVERKKEDLKFIMFLMVSTMLNLMLFLIPSCNKLVKNEEFQYESIRTGLISIAETDVKEYKKETEGEKALTNEIAENKMKVEENGKIAATSNSNMKSGVGNLNTKSKNSNIKANAGNTSNAGTKSLPRFIGPTREDNGISGVVLTSSKSKSLREKQEGNYETFGKSGGTDSLSVKSSGLKGVELGSNSLKDGTRALQTGNYEKNTIGINKENTSTNPKDSVKVVIDDNGINNSIPKNISANAVDVYGGRVVWRKYIKPDYPEEAEKNGLTGDVEVEFLIKNGKTNFLGVTRKSGYSDMDKSVEKVAKNWLLVIEKNGVSVNGKVRVKVKFDF